MPDFKPKPPMWYPGIRQGHPLAQGLVGYWPMWEGGGTRVMEVSGFGWHGGLATGVRTFPSWIHSEFGVVLYFNGASFGDSVLVGPGLSPVFVSGNFSVSVFCRPDALSAGVAWAVDGTDDLIFYPNDPTGTGGARLFWRDLDDSVSAVTPVTTGLWSQFVFTCTFGSNYTLRTYHNGILVHTNTGVTGSPGPFEIGFQIGYREGGSTNHFAGPIASMGVWNRPLTATEVAAEFADPWSLITPRRRSYFYAASGGSTASPWYYNLQQAVAA